MRLATTTSVLAWILCTFCAFPSSSVVLEYQPAKTGAQDIILMARGERMQLIDAYTGLPADAPSLGSSPAPVGGMIHWIQFSDITDDLGIRHVAYEQQLTHPLLSGTPLHNGVALAGGKLTFRYSRDRHLQSVNGGAFDNVTTIGPIAATTLDDARSLASTVVQTTAGIPILSDECERPCMPPYPW